MNPEPSPEPGAYAASPREQFLAKRSLDRLLPVAVAMLRQQGIQAQTCEAWESALRKLPAVSARALEAMRTFARMVCREPDAAEDFVDRVLVDLVDLWARRSRYRAAAGESRRDAQVIRAWVFCAMAHIDPGDDLASDLRRLVRPLLRRSPGWLLGQVASRILLPLPIGEAERDPRQRVLRAAAKARDWGISTATSSLPRVPDLFRVPKTERTALAALYPEHAAPLLLGIAERIAGRAGSSRALVTEIRRLVREADWFVTDVTKVATRYERVVVPYLDRHAGDRADLAYCHYLRAFRMEARRVHLAGVPPKPGRSEAGGPYTAVVMRMAESAIEAIRHEPRAVLLPARRALSDLQQEVLLRRIVVFAWCLGDYSREPMWSGEDIRCLAMDGRRFIENTRRLRMSWQLLDSERMKGTFELVDELRTGVVEPLESPAVLSELRPRVGRICERAVKIAVQAERSLDALAEGR